MKTNNNKRMLNGAGPWSFDVPELAPGESFDLDLRNMEFNGERRYFRKFLPMDTAQVTNLSADAAVRVTINGQFSDVVPPNVVEGYEDQTITHVRIENLSGSATISAGDVVLTLERTPYNADDRARDEASKPPAAGVIKKFTGLDVGGLLR